MAVVRFSRRAEEDLFDIATYTLGTWGKAQAAKYLDGLEATCQMLAKNPEMGRQCDHVRPGLRRSEHGRHVIFYRKEQTGILVTRLLHQNMIPEKHEY